MIERKGFQLNDTNHQFLCNNWLGIRSARCGVGARCGWGVKGVRFVVGVGSVASGYEELG